MPDNYYSFFREDSADGSYIYDFLTKNNVGYTVYFNIEEYKDFLDVNSYLFKNGFALGFVQRQFEQNAEKIADEMVCVTICEIIKDFIEFQGNEIVLLYHCDFSDSKQSFRNKLFDRWHKNYLSEILVRDSIEIEIPTDVGKESYYMGVMTPQNNPNLTVAEGEFQDFYIGLVNNI